MQQNYQILKNLNEALIFFLTYTLITLVLLLLAVL
jgi:hypothetical protein